MLELLLLILAAIQLNRYTKWQRITGDSSLKEFFRHEITEIKGLFK